MTQSLQTRRLFLFVAAVCLFVLATERPALAYADPGTGSLTWQLLIASFLGLVFYLQRGYDWLKGLIKKRGGKDLSIPTSDQRPHRTLFGRDEPAHRRLAQI